MSKQTPQGRNKEGNHGAVPPELTSSGRGGGRFNRGSGRFGAPKSSTLHPRQWFEGDIPELHGKTYELVGNKSADLYTETRKQQIGAIGSHQGPTLQRTRPQICAVINSSG